MGVGLWTLAALAAFGTARLIRPGRELHWVAEPVLAFLSGAFGGLLATYLDFGGWAVADWRAGLFIFFFSMAVLGAVRATFLLARRKARHPAVRAINAKGSRSPA